jgi:hypothetical protein
MSIQVETCKCAERSGGESGRRWRWREGGGYVTPDGRRKSEWIHGTWSKQTLNEWVNREEKKKEKEKTTQKVI